MSEQTVKNVTQKTYAKEKCDVCNKVLAKSSIKKHKKDQHNVIVVKKKENGVKNKAQSKNAR